MNDLNSHNMNYDKKLFTNVVFDKIDHKDCPDYVDAVIVSADYDGKPMDYLAISCINEDDELRWELLMEEFQQ